MLFSTVACQVTSLMLNLSHEKSESIVPSQYEEKIQIEMLSICRRDDFIWEKKVK